MYFFNGHIFTKPLIAIKCMKYNQLIGIVGVMSKFRHEKENSVGLQVKGIIF